MDEVSARQKLSCHSLAFTDGVTVLHRVKDARQSLHENTLASMKRENRPRSTLGDNSLFFMKKVISTPIHAPRLTFFVSPSSASTPVDLTSHVIPSPSLTDVITAVVHAYYIVQEQREASQECVARQSVYCDLDISTFEVLARDASVASLASTAATLEVRRRSMSLRAACGW